MKGNLKKLRYNIWFYFVIFSVTILALIWVFQIAFLETQYQNNKYRQIVSVGTSVCEAVPVDTLDNVARIAENSGMSLFILRANQANSYVYPSSGRPSSDYVDLINRCMLNVIQSDKDYVCYIEQVQSGSLSVYVYGSETMLADGNRVYVVLTTSLELIQDTVSVLRVQLVFISVIIIILALIVSAYIASKLSKPIVQMSDTAKKLARGDYSVVFEGNGYTEIDDLADSLNFAKEELNRTDTLRKDLLANVSHDLKTPITMIKAYAEMIKDISGNNKEKRTEHTQVIIDEADRLTNLINDILNLTKLQTDVDALKLEPINISELVASVVDHFEGIMGIEGYTFVRDIDEELFSVVDDKKIEQAVYNYISNAVSYTGDDKIVKVTLKKVDDKIARLDVIDTGKGIDKENIKTIWEKYYRYSESHKRSTKGTGLGLSIVQAILESHNLRYGVYSKVGVGSDFFVDFVLIPENVGGGKKNAK